MSFYILCPCGCKKQLFVSDDDFYIMTHDDGTHSVGELMQSPCGYKFFFKKGVVKEFVTGSLFNVEGAEALNT